MRAFKFLISLVIVVLAAGDVLLMFLTSAINPFGGGMFSIVVYVIAAIALIISIWCESLKGGIISLAVMAILSFYPGIISEMSHGANATDAISEVMARKMIPWWYKLLTMIFPAASAGTEVLASPLPSPMASLAPIASGELARDGFLGGLWHGFRSPVMWIGSFFLKDWQVYSATNDGTLYLVGFIIGVVVVVFLLLGLIQGIRESGQPTETKKTEEGVSE